MKRSRLRRARSRAAFGKPGLQAKDLRHGPARPASKASRTRRGFRHAAPGADLPRAPAGQRQRTFVERKNRVIWVQRTGECGHVRRYGALQRRERCVVTAGVPHQRDARSVRTRTCAAKHCRRAHAAAALPRSRARLARRPDALTRQPVEQYRAYCSVSFACSPGRAIASRGEHHAHAPDRPDPPLPAATAQQRGQTAPAGLAKAVVCQRGQEASAGSTHTAPANPGARPTGHVCAAASGTARRSVRRGDCAVRSMPSQRQQASRMRPAS